MDSKAEGQNAAKTLVPPRGSGEDVLRVAIIDSDSYARDAINALLAWDYWTRVVLQAGSLTALWGKLDEWQAKGALKIPDVVVLDINYAVGFGSLSQDIEKLREAMPGVMVICLAQDIDLNSFYNVLEGGARAFFLKDDVGMHIGWALYYAKQIDQRCFFISKGLAADAKQLQPRHEGLRAVKLLPGPRQIPGLSPRKREAALLYSTRGLSSHSAVAREMGLKVVSVSDYISHAYDILADAEVEFVIPNDMSAQEIAFTRLTALEPITIGCDDESED